jgi:hypothetical protein
MAAPRYLKQKACEVCGERDQLFSCPCCQVVFFCRKEHQPTEKTEHKKTCLAVGKARLLMETEERDLRDPPPSPLGLAANNEGDLFEIGAGHFWRIHETRDYMRARYAMAHILLRRFGGVGGYAVAVEAALDHYLDMLRLSRIDSMRVRDLIPALYIRLCRDQEGYDFMKWYATAGTSLSYDWGDMGLSFLDVRDADVLESPVGIWTQRSSLALSHAVPVMLVKVRVLLDLQTVQNATAVLQTMLPQEIIDIVSDQLVGNVTRMRQEILKGGWRTLAKWAKVINSQVKSLYKSIDEDNPYFWDVLLNPAEALMSDWQNYVPGSREESYNIVSSNYYAWAETPGALEMIRRLI